MKVDFKYNSPSCKALRPNDLSKFSEQQQTIINNIKGRLNYSYSDCFDGKTPLKYYEDKGYDFFVRQGKKRDSVELDIIDIKDNPKDASVIKIDRDSGFIGDYDENSTYKVKVDLCSRENRLNESAKSFIGTSLALLLFAIASIITVTLPKQSSKIRTKNIEQISNKIMSDTTKASSKDTIALWHNFSSK